MFHSSLWKFNLDIDKKWLFLISVTIAPGMLLSIITKNPIWFAASFLAANSILPLSNTFSSKFFAILYSVLLCSLAYLIKFLLVTHSYAYMLLFFSALALFCGIIDNEDKKFRYIAAGLIIASIYGGEQLMSAPISVPQLLLILLVSVFSVSLVLFTMKSERINIRPQLIGISKRNFIFNFKYVCPMVVSILVWYKFNIQEPQWLIWSSLSVVYPDLDALSLKFQQRMFGVLCGVVIGVIISALLPKSIVVTFLCFTLTLLSLGMFKHYFPSYLLRCLCAVVYAGNQSSEIASTRLCNVIIGGLIGVICTILLVKLQEFWWSKRKSLS